MILSHPGSKLFPVICISSNFLSLPVSVSTAVVAGCVQRCWWSLVHLKQILSWLPPVGLTHPCPHKPILPTRATRPIYRVEVSCFVVIGICQVLPRATTVVFHSNPICRELARPHFVRIIYPQIRHAVGYTEAQVVSAHFTTWLDLCNSYIRANKSFTLSSMPNQIRFSVVKLFYLAGKFVMNILVCKKQCLWCSVQGSCSFTGIPRMTMFCRWSTAFQWQISRLMFSSVMTRAKRISLE